MFIFWQPSGNIADLVLETYSLRNTLTIETITHGDSDDLFIWPLPGNMFEAPTIGAPQALRGLERRARFA